MLVLGTFLGRAVSAAARGEFRAQLPRAPRQVALRLLGALMTGAGAVLGLGCTVGHRLSGLSVLALGSALGLACSLKAEKHSFAAEAFSFKMRSLGGSSTLDFTPVHPHSSRATTDSLDASKPCPCDA